MGVNVTGLGIITNIKVEIKQYNKSIIQSLLQKKCDSGNVVTDENILSAKLLASKSYK